jgi:hypothetical protein
MLTATLIVLFTLTLGSIPSWADPLEGSWQLTAYEMQGKTVPVSGVMIFADGHWASVYAMDVEGAKSARAHGGTYQLDGTTLTFDVPWWVEHVSGKPRVLEKPAEAKGQIEQEGDSLVIRFASGSVQKFSRVRSDGEETLRGAWLMEDYSSSAKSGPTSGLVLFSGKRFAMIYTMRPEGGMDGRGHAGSYETNDDTLKLVVDWSLQYVSGDGSVAEKTSERETKFSIEGETLTLIFGSGASMTFKGK